MYTIADPRSVVATAFLGLFLIICTILGGVCCSLGLRVLLNLVKETSNGNGGKYRYWLQIFIKNTMSLVLGSLFNIIVVLSQQVTWPLTTPVCWIVGYSHVTLIALGLSFTCAFQFYQYLSVVVMPLEHPKYKHNVVIWALTWCIPALTAALLPATTATDVNYVYGRMGCSFQRDTNNNHDTALLVFIATAAGFTCVFSAVLTLKVYGAQNEEKVLQKDTKHISLFGDRQVKENRKQKTIAVSAEAHNTDFRMISLYSVLNISILVPYVCVVFVASANSGSLAREGEELATLLLGLVPTLDFTVLMFDVVVRNRILADLSSLDYLCKCFYVRNVLCAGKVTPTATILVNTEERSGVEDVV